MPAFSSHRTKPVPYALPPDALEGLLRLAAHVALTETASLFLQKEDSIWPLAASGVSSDACHTAALLLPDLLGKADVEMVIADASQEREPASLLASVLAGQPGLLIVHRFALEGQKCQAILLLAHPVPRQQIGHEVRALLSEISRQVALRVEARVEKLELEAMREKQATLHLHLGKLGARRCLGNCIVNAQGRLLMVSETLENNLGVSAEGARGLFFEDLFVFNPTFLEQQGDSPDPIELWNRVHYTGCTYISSNGSSTRMLACALQIPYPGEPMAWSVAFLRGGEVNTGAGGTERPKQTVLIAEDHPVNQKVIQGMVEKLGLAAEIVSNGLEAVHAVCHNTYAAVLMDCQMPEMDGIEATRFIRANEDRIGRVPIIAVTAFGQDDDRIRCMEAGVDEFMVKPIRMEILAEVLSRWANASESNLEGGPVDKDSPASRRLENALDRLRVDLDTDVVRDIVMLFIDDSAARFGHLAVLVKEQRWEEIRALVHTVKGSASSLGAMDLVEACEAFEDEAGNNVEALLPRIAMIEQRFREVVPMLKRYVDTLT